jgi:hypothetical protein
VGDSQFTTIGRSEEKGDEGRSLLNLVTGSD